MSDSSESLSPPLVSELMEANVLFGRSHQNVILDLPPGDRFPNIKKEIFRSIEGNFKTIGADTGTGIKTDEFNESIFHQLISVRISSERDSSERDSSERKYSLLAGYRYDIWEGLMKDLKTPMTHSFDIHDETVDPQRAKVLELGTAWGNSFIDPKRQSIGFGHMWHGLAALVNKYDNDYFIGKLTIPAQYNPKARDFAINYLQNYALPPYCFDANPKAEYVYSPEAHDVSFSSKNRSEDNVRIFAILNTPEYGNEKYLPAMFPMYIPRLLPEKFHCIGTILNGKVRETGIVVPTGAIRPEVHGPYREYLESFQKKFGTNPNITLGEYMER